MNHKITIKMPKHDLAVWLATLRMRANQKKQGTDTLFHDGKYCCLGAAQYCKVGAVSRGDDLDTDWLREVGWKFWHKNVGWGACEPSLPSLGMSAVQANDSGKYTFAQIADAIERHAEGY